MTEVENARFEDQFRTLFIVKQGEDQAVVSGDLRASKVEAGPYTSPLFGCTFGTFRGMSWVGS